MSAVSGPSPSSAAPAGPRTFSRAQRRTIRLANLYPPFLGAGIRVRVVPGERGGLAVETRMRLSAWNRNYVGTHFGGSLYMMCDPFFMMLLIWELGPGYVVWDKAATVRFRKPGRGTVRARFEVPPERVEEIRRAAGGGKVEPSFTTVVVDGEGDTVADVDKLLYVRLRDSRGRS